jgi:2-C-methyl-D-erythritol 4-phosphate cytidylyltransferase
MIYGGILAGGVGKRMGYTELPKQLMQLGDKPIIIHTIEKFLACPNIDYILVGIHFDWELYYQDIACRFFGSNDRIIFTAGGSDRNSTIMSLVAEIESKFGIHDDDIIVTHDAVRPFVTRRIIEENIIAAKNWGACDTVILASDTIVQSEDGELITNIPDRRFFYQGQTPQSFNIKLLRQHYNELTENEKEILTDACKILVLKGKNVYLVDGDVYNFKITTPNDYKIAQALIGAIDHD